MVDVRRDAVDFGREGNGGAGDANDFSMTQLEIAALRMFSASVWQAATEKEKKAPLPLSI
jgi:hypothetical protein